MLESIYENVVKGDLKQVTEHVQAALEAAWIWRKSSTMA